MSKKSNEKKTVPNKKQLNLPAYQLEPEDGASNITYILIVYVSSSHLFVLLAPTDGDCWDCILYGQE